MSSSSSSSLTSTPLSKSSIEISRTVSTSLIWLDVSTVATPFSLSMAGWLLLISLYSVLKSALKSLSMSAPESSGGRLKSSAKSAPRTSASVALPSFPSVPPPLIIPAASKSSKSSEKSSANPLASSLLCHCST